LASVQLRVVLAAWFDAGTLTAAGAAAPSATPYGLKRPSETLIAVFPSPKRS
jgi:hypothetical protein